MKMSRIVSCMIVPLLGGCSIIMASKLPIARPPEKLVEGVERAFVDGHYGYPLAIGKNGAGLYTEQIQFIDGTPVGWKIARCCIHGGLDACTYFLWEFIGTPIELCNMKYPVYVYFVIYDENNRIIRTVNADTPEGKKYMALDWSVPRDPDLKVNLNDNVRKESIGVPPKNVASVPVNNGNGLMPPQAEKEQQKKALSSFEALQKLRQDGEISEQEYNERILKFMEEKK